MTTLIEGQFDLDGYLFGGEGDPLVTEPGGFDHGFTGWRTQDQFNPSGDSVAFGRDLRSPTTWSWTMMSNQDDLAGALDAISDAEAAWEGRSVRLTPGLVLPLRYCLAGRTRRVYGRPRRFSHNLDPLAWQGWVNVIADFARVDTLYYDDETRVAGLGVLPGTTTGIVSPLIGPLATIGAGPETVTPLDNIGGTVPAPFVAVINGPITAPYIEGDDWKLHLNISLAWDQSAIIDTRPWAMTVLRQDGASLAGAVTNNSSLRLARLDPNGSTIRFGGIDATGTANCQIAWRPTYHSL